MPAIPPVAIALISLLALGPTLQEAGPIKEEVHTEVITKSTDCSVTKETVLFKEARTEIHDADRTFDVMVTPAGSAFGTAAALSAGTLELDAKEHDWFALSQGWIVVQINPPGAKGGKATTVQPEDWPVVRIRMLDAGAEGTRFGVATGKDADGHEFADIMLFEGGPVWAAKRNDKREAEVAPGDAETYFIRATFPNNNANTLPEIKTLEYEKHADAALRRIVLMKRAKVWSAAEPPE